jgi:hypothetical protein
MRKIILCPFYRKQALLLLLSQAWLDDLSRQAGASSTPMPFG